MKPPTIDCAVAMRDGGIDAVATLNEALRDALEDLPAEQRRELKHALGKAMSAVLDETVNPAVGAFPILESNESTWIAIAKARAAIRASQ